MVILNAVYFSNFAKFHGNMKIMRKRANSAVWLKIPRPAENCRP